MLVAILFATPRVYGQMRKEGTPTRFIHAKLSILPDSAQGEKVSGAALLKIPQINSADRDNTPLITADGNLLFFNSTRQGSRPWARLRTDRSRYDDDMYYASRASDSAGVEQWGNPVDFPTPINTSEDDGVAAISPTGETIFFLSLKKGWQNDGGPFYGARLHGAEWSDIHGLGGGITKFFNQKEGKTPIRIYGASVGASGRVFYFATTLHAGTNNHEIWVSRLGDSGWSYPENLGPVVNAGGGSYAPCIAADGQTLYFASGRPGGLGGDDIYVTSYRDGRWEEPVNLGAPINSSGHDAFLSLPASGDRAYFSSDRDGNDDIFEAPLARRFRPAGVLLFQGSVQARESGRPIEAMISVVDRESGATVFQANSNEATGGFSVILHPGHDYAVTLTAPGYVFMSDHFLVPASNQYKETTKIYAMERPGKDFNFSLNNVFFDNNEATLTPESHGDLDRLALLLVNHERLRIRVIGYTDTVGSSTGNLTLSQRRAAAVREYLTATAGIDTARIEAVGEGAGHPVASNDTEDGRRQNRRVEFVVLNEE
ncbi:MAG: hypothetical protein JWQ98_700 [Chlorobi bacterium]|nr:hypothetical protein [Chlorobiota bacterium]